MENIYLFIVFLCSDLNNEEKKSEFDKALPQIIATVIKNVLLMAFGMTLGYPTILIARFSENNPNETFTLGPDAISWISKSFSFSCSSNL